MHQVVEFFSGLFATEQWPARWHCGTWSDFHGWLYIISDTMIWLAYFLIPIIILKYFTGKKGQVKFSGVYILFATFILLCGSTHFIDAMMFWIPMYRLGGLVKFATGIVSIFTVRELFKILPVLFSQKTNLELEDEIARRKQAELRLAEANANLASFAHIASHDLQEPLRKIRTFSSVLRSSNPDLSDRNRQLVDRIESSAGRMQNLVKDVLTISTIDREIELTNVNMNEVLAMALSDLEVKITEKKAAINTSPLPSVLGNKAYLAQVFMNIISNAIKFSKSDPVIFVKSVTDGNNVVISISDNGIGIEKQDLEKIFKTFKRLHSKDEYEGSGIGLSTCKRIIELHHGKISVQSTPGIGTTFLIELPKD